jgi:hypothetical protein
VKVNRQAVSSVWKNPVPRTFGRTAASETDAPNMFLVAKSTASQRRFE